MKFFSVLGVRLKSVMRKIVGWWSSSREKEIQANRVVWKAEENWNTVGRMNWLVHYKDLKHNLGDYVCVSVGQWWLLSMNECCLVSFLISIWSLVVFIFPLTISVIIFFLVSLARDLPAFPPAKSQLLLCWFYALPQLNSVCKFFGVF